LIDVDAMSGSFATVEHSRLEAVIVREDGVGLGGVPHVFLNDEILRPRIEVQRGSHGHWREIRRPMTASAHLVEAGKIGDAAQMRDTASTHDRAADVVDELILD